MIIQHNTITNLVKANRRERDPIQISTPTYYSSPNLILSNNKLHNASNRITASENMLARGGMEKRGVGRGGVRHIRGVPYPFLTLKKKKKKHE